jgi:hypothetical protein
MNYPSIVRARQVLIFLGLLAACLYYSHICRLGAKNEELYFFKLVEPLRAFDTDKELVEFDAGNLSFSNLNILESQDSRFDQIYVHIGDNEFFCLFLPDQLDSIWVKPRYIFHFSKRSNFRDSAIQIIGRTSTDGAIIELPVEQVSKCQQFYCSLQK